MIVPLRQDSEEQSEDEEENHLDMKGMFNVEASEEEKRENSDKRSSEMSREASFRLGKEKPMPVHNESNIIRIGRSNKAKVEPSSSNNDEEMGNSDLNSG